MTLALIAYAVMALAWSGAAVLAGRDVWLWYRAQRRSEGAQAAQAAKNEAAMLSAPDAPHRWPGPVLPDAARDIARRKDRMEAQWQAAIRRRDDALRGLARHEAADWTGWRPSYDGEDVDPGEPWRPAD